MVDMAYRLLGSLFILAHNDRSPPDQTWQEYLADMRRLTDLGEMRTLVLTPGGGPNAKQRMAMNAILDGRRTPVAVVTPSFVARGIITSLSLFNPEIRAFSPRDAQAAYDFLGLDVQTRRLAESVARQLRASVEPTRRHAPAPAPPPRQPPIH
jgi:hypothetical protein